MTDFGFVWDGPEDLIVERMASIDRGKRGVWRVLSLRAGRNAIEVYVTPHGQMRAYMLDTTHGGRAEMFAGAWDYPDDGDSLPPVVAGVSVGGEAT